MNNSRLNINIYEHIIDTLNNNSYWCTTALVCSAWCRRSQYNLFRTVHLCRQSQVELLVQTFRTNALLVDLVTSLTVDFTGQLRDHPLIWVPLLWEVKKCSALDLMGIDWTRYPDMYASSVLREVQRCGSSTITTLKIKLFQTVFRPTLLLIQALPCLKNLVVYCPRRLHTTSHTFAAAIPKQAACNRLHSLELQLDSAEVSFPLQSFGANVEELAIQMPQNSRASDETLGCIRAFRRLQALRVACYIDTEHSGSAAARIKCLLSVLSIVGSSVTLRSLDIRLSCDTALWSYLVDRVGLLDSLCSAEMVEALDRFPALRNLSFMLYDNKPQHDRQWWEAELVTRLPSHLQSAVTVSVQVFMMDEHTFKELYDGRRVQD